MNFIAKILEKPLDKLNELSQPGQPLEKMHRAVEAFDTFARTPALVTESKVHIRDSLDSKRLMSTVILALIPAVLFGMWNTGMQTINSVVGLDASFLNAMFIGAKVLIPQLVVSYAVGLGIEFIFALIRNHEVNEGFLVTGMLIPLTMPAEIPLWMIGVGTAFGVIFAKEVFGGTGFNFLNPALTARAFIFFSYPTKISGDNVWRAIEAHKEQLVDGYSGATPLAIAATAPRGTNVVEQLSEAGFNFKNMLIGTIPGSIGETSVIAFGIGALILLITGVASYKVMLSTIVGGAFMGIVFNLFGSETSLAFMNLPWYYHLVMGGFAFGAVFMTTDPVSAAATSLGKYIYGFLIGVLAILIRVLNPAYPEGMMLAILFMNIFAPLIDWVILQLNIRRRLARA
ncbi:MAG: NADH:ubiquinone reductase (Na(+)-transporting) subunit B [Fibrobacter sp.]|nr:NADH:ubiquinone reductase (Na(+)-transporting) subunit B [Fibrobacter sp.]